VGKPAPPKHSVLPPCWCRPRHLGTGTRFNSGNELADSEDRTGAALPPERHPDGMSLTAGSKWCKAARPTARNHTSNPTPQSPPPHPSHYPALFWQEFLPPVQAMGIMRRISISSATHQPFSAAAVEPEQPLTTSTTAAAATRELLANPQ
jgi:hypothetical protein